MLKKILLSLLVTTQAFGSVGREIEADTIKSSDNTKTFTFPAASDQLQGKINPEVTGSITANHISTPSNPSAGFLKLYTKSDNKLYKLTSAGVESAVGGGAASEVTVTPVGSLIATDVQAALQELDADLTASLALKQDASTAATDTELANHEADTTSIHGISNTANLLTTTNVVGVEGKTLVGPVIGDYADFFEGGTPANPAAGDLRLYSKNSHKLYTLSSDGVETELGSGGGAINYISPWHDAENGITGWATYADAAGTSPVDGTGGSPSVTVTQTSSSPLRGTNSFLITKGASNRQGDGVKYDFTIASADKYTVQTIKFAYEIPSGTYADGDIKLYIYDVTNSALLEPVGYSLYNTTVNGKHQATFQSTGSTSYRLIFHVSSTSASAYTVKIDDVEVGPGVKARGPMISDPVNASSEFSTTTSFVSFGTSSNIVVEKWRNGKFTSYKGRFTTGTTAAAAGYIQLPAGITIDTTTIGSSPRQYGWIRRITSASTGVHESHTTAVFDALIYNGTNADRLYVSASVQTNAYVTANISTIFDNTSPVEFEFSVPVLGQSSSQVLSSEEDGRILVAQYHLSANFSASTTTPINFDTKENDTHNAVTTSPTAWKFTAPLPGYYVVAGYWNSTTSAQLQIYKNGTVLKSAGYDTNTIDSAYFTTVKLNAGDYIDLRPNASVTVGGAALNNFASNINIYRLTGPSQIAAAETVAAVYTTTAAQSISNNTRTIVDWGTRIDDSHASVTTGASWKFTAPMSGLYEVNASMLWTSTTAWGLTEAMNLTVHVDGNSTPTRYLYYTTGLTSGGSSVAFPMEGVTQVRLTAGQYIDVRVMQISGGSLAMDSTTGMNYVTIKRVGN